MCLDTEEAAGGTFLEIEETAGASSKPITRIVDVQLRTTTARSYVSDRPVRQVYFAQVVSKMSTERSLLGGSCPGKSPLG